MTALLLFVVLFKGIFGLRLVRLDVPTAVILGSPVWINCSYDLEKDDLYSVKWYKNNVEFYRYLPSDAPPAQMYSSKGVNIDLTRSSFGSVYLSSSDHKTEGTYRCEVSTEGPSFQTVRESKELRIFALPQEGPRITGTRPQYRVGDTVNTTCTSGPSKPSATLKWFINGKRAMSSAERQLESHRHPDKLESSVLRLTFMVEPVHFSHGMMKLRCTAVISEAYSMSSEEIIVGDNARPGVHFTDDGGDGPTITGGLPRYQVGDIVDVNCTASKSKPPAELQWFLNDRKAPMEHYQHYPPISYMDGQRSAILGLRFTVRSSHFDRNEMRLKCTATLSKVINMSNEETVVGSSQQSSLLHIFENSGATLNAGNRSAFSVWLLATLFIVVFARCSSSCSQPTAIQSSTLRD